MKKETKVLLTVKEACKVLKVSRMTLHRWNRDGKLKAVKIGVATMYKYSSIIKHLSK